MIERVGHGLDAGIRPGEAAAHGSSRRRGDALMGFVAVRIGGGGGRERHPHQRRDEREPGGATDAGEVCFHGAASAARAMP